MLIYIKYKDSSHETDKHYAEDYYVQDGILTLTGKSGFVPYNTYTKHFAVSEILSIEINEK